ncbi:hypothetical protein [Candidatus Tisiphia endosymbiont of Metellina segmentata]|uniref:hypothetical protein n=1 Tax=Candidatus Tisiphia endosymbiont of Metellina segmentata TaxID=3066274 RepID=UPI00313ACB59
MKNTQYNFNSPSFTFNPSQSLRYDVKGVFPTQHITKIPEFNSSIFNPPQHTIKADFKDTSHTQYSFNVQGVPKTPAFNPSTILNLLFYR